MLIKKEIIKNWFLNILVMMIKRKYIISKCRRNWKEPSLLTVQILTYRFSSQLYFCKILLKYQFKLLNYL